MSLFKGKATNIAVIQYRIMQDDMEDNLQKVATLITAAKSKGANFICLPANFATGINFPSLRQNSQSLHDIQSFLSKQALEHEIQICAGVLEWNGGDIYDSAILIGSDGQLLAKYRRASLWEDERDFISQGKACDVIDTPLGRIGLLVSYDIRFPESSRHYFQQEVDILVCVANLFTRYSFPVETLCRARAADNGCCVVFASGLGNNRLAMMDYMGRSMIVDGLCEAISDDNRCDILAQAGQEESTITAIWYPRQQRKVRLKQPYLHDYIRMSSIKHGEG
ncbi:carbon-nitrogen hydrolase family protein [Shewanella woodyi]|uniref:Nitrilase/cyanide hydratase and apolipoprotein N-acyltransferase n=1 Tax=Shewanella woodyi (strain ATCC 51908 / MS32) TaxID=392500 RepID=B1KQQ0_SHEWM|nr:carbon-nitrogen hydrolase family protein [Shewanella woodyi]ACA86289.1 Nitrilase/cyanide hydratase and apolipoprotein N-acyltransferase [Shewanella woodyi ATCC 51908]